MLLVDDGSTDDSTAIAQRCARQHPHCVHYLEHPSHENRGAASTRNLGVRYARGPYVAFLDADDVWLPRKLEQQVEIMSACPEAGLVCGATLWGGFGWTGRPEHVRSNIKLRVGVPMWSRSGNALVEDRLVRPPALMTLVQPLGRGAPPSMSNIMVRREVIEQLGGYQWSLSRSIRRS